MLGALIVIGFDLLLIVMLFIELKIRGVLTCGLLSFQPLHRSLCLLYSYGEIKLKTRKQFMVWLQSNREMKFGSTPHKCPLAKFYGTWVGYSMIGAHPTWGTHRTLRPWEFKMREIADNIRAKDGTFTGQDMLDAIERKENENISAS